MRNFRWKRSSRTGSAANFPISWLVFSSIFKIKDYLEDALLSCGLRVHQLRAAHRFCSAHPIESDSSRRTECKGSQTAWWGNGSNLSKSNVKYSVFRKKISLVSTINPRSDLDWHSHQTSPHRSHLFRIRSPELHAAHWSEEKHSQGIAFLCKKFIYCMLIVHELLSNHLKIVLFKGGLESV